MLISCVFISRSYWIHEIVDCKHCHVDHVGGSPKWCATTIDRRLDFYTIKWYVLFLITSYFTWDNPHIASSSQSSLECVQRGFCLLLELRFFSWEATTELSLGIISFGLGCVLVIVCYLFWDSGVSWWETVWNFFSSHQKSWYRTHSGGAVSRKIRWSSVPW